DRGRLALPHRHRGRDSPHHAGRRLQLSVGRAQPAVRSRQRRARDDARRSAVALLLRHRVLAQGAAAGAGGIGEGRDRLEDRRAAALLLSLRPRVGTVRGGGHESDPAGRGDHRGTGGRLHPADAASRNAHARGGSRVGIMLSSIPIFPAQASTFAADVDKLYFLILAVTSFFAIAVVIFVAYFAIRYQDESGTQVGAPIHGSIPLELAWSFIPF